jgi:hypothetical protein
VITVRIAAIDEHMFSSVAPHVSRTGLSWSIRFGIVQGALKRGLSGSALVSGPVVSRGCSVKAMKSVRRH